MKVYLARYCPCIFESSYGTLSIHKTREGAENAMNNHRNEELKSFTEMLEGSKNDDFDLVFGEHEGWDVKEEDLLD